MKNKNKLFKIGILGLTILICLNLIGLLVLQQPAAVFFSKQWWSVWFPCALPFIAFSIVGLAQLRVQDHSKE